MAKQLTTLHERITQEYRGKIKSGQYIYGQKNDTEFQICNKYNVSRITARRVLMNLEKEGLVSRYKAKGTICIWKSNIEIQLFPDCDLVDTVKNLDRKVWFKQLSKEKIRADFFMALAMDIKEGEKLIETKQILMVDEVKVAYIVSEILSAKDNIFLKTTSKIKAMLPLSEVQIILNLPKEQPILLKEVFFYDDKNNVQQYDQYYYRGDCVFIGDE